MENDFLDNSKSSSTRNLTLESLLDAQGPKEGSPGDGSKRKTSEFEDYVVHPIPPTKRPRGQIFRAKEACLELIAILLQQDVNGFFHFSPKKVLSLHSSSGSSNYLSRCKLLTAVPSAVDSFKTLVILVCGYFPAICFEAFYPIHESGTWLFTSFYLLSLFL